MSDTPPATDDPSDEELARRVQHGDPAALEQLARRYLRPMHAVIASYLAEPADVEDAVQDVFVRAIERLGSYDAARPFAPWLYQVARNVARDRLTASRRQWLEPLAPELPAGSADPLVAAELAETRRRIAAAVQRLPEQQRTAFRLRDVEGYEAGEIAHLMGLTPGTVRSHVHHARRALRATLRRVPGESESGGG